MTIKCLIVAITALTIAAAPATPVAAPVLSVGDRWIFDQISERPPQGFDERRLDMRIEHVGGDTVLVGVKRDGAPGAYEDHLVGADWSIRRLIDGKDAATARPFTFPMSTGQKWTIDYVDSTRRGLQLSARIHRTYDVVGWEEVTVPAGRFQALKVEAAGVDHATVAVPAAVTGVASPDGATVMRGQAGGTRPVIVRTHDELYYVPSIKNYVKSIEEQYNTDDVLTSRQTRTLISFQPAV